MHYLLILSGLALFTAGVALLPREQKTDEDKKAETTAKPVKSVKPVEPKEESNNE